MFLIIDSEILSMNELMHGLRVFPIISGVLLYRIDLGRRIIEDRLQEVSKVEEVVSLPFYSQLRTLLVAIMTNDRNDVDWL